MIVVVLGVEGRKLASNGFFFSSILGCTVDCSFNAVSIGACYPFKHLRLIIQHSVTSGMGLGGSRFNYDSY